MISAANGEVLVQTLFRPSAADVHRVPAPFLASPGLPRLHYARFYLVVPDIEGLRVDLLGGEYDDSDGPIPELEKAENGGPAFSDLLPEKGFFPEEPFLVSRPFYFRKTLLVAIDCFAVQIDYEKKRKRVWSSYRLRVRYPPNPAGSPPGKLDRLVSKLVINREHAPVRRGHSRAGGASLSVPDPHFSLSRNWVKITVKERAMYAVTGEELFSLGIDLQRIDPTTFRLYSSGGRAQERTLRDSTGTWLPGNWMRECAVWVRDGGDGSFDPGDSLVFYGLGSRDWLDLYESGASETEFYEHSYANNNVYFLTWNGSFGGEPSRMVYEKATPTSSTYDTTFSERALFEKDLVKNFSFGGDGWRWMDITKKSGPEVRNFPLFAVKDIDHSEPQRFRTIAIAPFCKSKECLQNRLNEDHHAVYWMNGTLIGEYIWDTPMGGRYTEGIVINLRGDFLKEGANRLSLEIPRDLNPRDFMYFEWYAVFYRRHLRAQNDELAFSSSDTAGSVNFRIKGFSSGSTVHLFEVTDQFHPRILSAFTVESQGTVLFSSSFSGRRKHFWACAEGVFKKPYRIEVYAPKDLRNANTSPHMLIVSYKAFVSAAEVLKAHREAHFPNFSDPRVSVVTTEEVFDNFSGGLHDPVAIRNYCKFLYDNFTDQNGFPELQYLLLFGDANTDYKNISTSQPDYVPTNLSIERVESMSDYATDDWFTLMDLSDEAWGMRTPDLAVGRLPAGNLSEAFFLTNKIIQYELGADLGPWRDVVVLVADDEVSSRTSRDDMFTLQSEEIASEHLPPYIDVHKIYLTEFPFVGSIKPASRKFFLEEWNKGALVVNYIGHGSSVQMADEQVFLSSDVGNLNNGRRLPLLVAVSCTIGDFDNALARSLSEKLLLKKGGGIIGAITASQAAYVGPNFLLDYHFFESVFPSEAGLAEPLGFALVEAKMATVTFPNEFYLQNNEKYNLLSDPALKLLIPHREVKFDPQEVDTVVTGLQKEIHGSVYRDSTLDTQFSGRVHLFVRESDDTSGYRRESDGFSIAYHYPGGVIYRGTADVRSGRFVFNFHVPRYSSPGPYAYLMAYAENESNDAVAVKKDVVLVYASSVSDSTLSRPKDGAPRVDIGFKGGAEVVKPGAILQAAVRDADGINILRTTNEGKQTLIFDEGGIPVDVTEFFTFEHGGSDTSGILLYPLPDISVGNHAVLYKVGDSFGQITIDTLSFEVIETTAYLAKAVLNYPNPFRSFTYFLFDLSDRARIHLDIFTTSGRRIRTIEETRGSGYAWVYWDGLDGVGDRVANGAYLYVARIAFIGAERPPITLRGKVVKLE